MSRLLNDNQIKLTVQSVLRPEKPIEPHAETRSIQTRLLAMQRSAAKSETEYLDAVSRFALAHQRLRDLLEARTISVEHLAGTISHASLRLRATLPTETRKCGHGKLSVAWSIGSAGVRDATFSWMGQNIAATRWSSVVAEVNRAHIAVPEEHRPTVWDCVARSLHDGTLMLPEFTREDTTDAVGHSWYWQRSALVIETVDEESARQALEKLTSEQTAPKRVVTRSRWKQRRRN